MALLERNPSGKNWAGRRSISRWGVAALAVPLLVSGCGDALGMDGTPTKDLTLAVDCAANPQATARLQVMQLREVQLIMATISGQGFTDTWRVQVMPPHSDLNITPPKGGEPSYTVQASDVETGAPQLTPLKHGGLTIQQVAPEATPTAVPSPMVSGSPVPTQPTGPVLEVMVSCQAPLAGQ